MNWQLFPGGRKLMLMPRKCLLFLSLLLLPLTWGRGAEPLQEMPFTIDGVTRTALVYAPASAKTKAAPLVFVFHGHGGDAQRAARMFHTETLWPEAIVVYLQGVPTPIPPTDVEGKQNGWQIRAGTFGDRDLKFFDAVFARMKQDYRVDGKRIYSTGHSNGGYFTLVLWLKRAEVFAAVAPSAAALVFNDPLTPKPVMHLSGEKDTLVAYARQQKAMETERRVNGCDTNGTAWDKGCTLYPSKGGTPVVTFIHPGGHGFDPAEPGLIVKFFKEHPAATAAK